MFQTSLKPDYVSCTYRIQVLHICVQECGGIEAWKAHWCEGLRLFEGVIGPYQIGEQQKVMGVHHVGSALCQCHDSILCQQHSKHGACTLHTHMSNVKQKEATVSAILTCG